MKKFDKKGFTLVELLATVAILGILTGIAITAYTRYIDYTRKRAYQYMVKSAQTAMNNYLLDQPAATEVTFEELFEGQYLDKTVDPKNSREVCRGRVKIKQNPDANLNHIGDGLEKDEYQTSICCIDYNYTYESNGARHQDRFCKLGPYNIEDIDNIKVLNVYPCERYKTSVKDWMDEYGKNSSGRKIIEVTPVSMDNFNANPQSYLGSVGNWNYDVIIFGFADANKDVDSGQEKDLTATSVEKVRQYLSSGGAAIFGHDTIIARHTYFAKLSGFVNLDVTGDTAWQGKTQLTIQKQGIFTEYPYDIWTESGAGRHLTIATSHVFGQIAHGDVWITFDGISTPAKSVYLSTYGNNAFIQTGHTNGSATDQEKKIIANIIFYMVAQQYVE